jgi:hypothetical protein
MDLYEDMGQARPQHGIRVNDAGRCHRSGRAFLGWVIGRQVPVARRVSALRVTAWSAQR